jgi:hypothetical protein
MTLPERADYSLTESALSPFPAEPAHARIRSGVDPMEFGLLRMQIALDWAERQWFPYKISVLLDYWCSRDFFDLEQL